MDSKPIGVLDSGIGGLTIWKEIVRELPHESTIYIADSKNCPYGSKSSEKIHLLAKKLIKFLISKNVKLIVVACNTITVNSLEKLREAFPHIPIVGTVPVVKTAAKHSKNGRIGILSTSGTAKSKYQKDLIEKFAKGKHVVNIGTDELVALIEQGKDVDGVLPTILKPFKKANIDTLALGCSHYPLIKKEIQQELGSRVLILDSGAAIARQVHRVLTVRSALTNLEKSSYAFYTTGDLSRFGKIVKTIIANSKFEYPLRQSYSEASRNTKQYQMFKI